jgi:hypothetical protein
LNLLKPFSGKGEHVSLLSAGHIHTGYRKLSLRIENISSVLRNLTVNERNSLPATEKSCQAAEIQKKKRLPSEIPPADRSETLVEKMQIPKGRPCQYFAKV